jgi:RNA polymerase sigma factor (sigma-70 family)
MTNGGGGSNMAASSSDHVLRQVNRVFNLGAVGSLPDAQLLEWFVSLRDETAEAAFEELMIRHGPMVFGVCRRVLQDVHDAQDAFQAVFLVLAHRAGSIRRKASVASWLFGVAQRVSRRARSRAARRRAIDKMAAERTSERFVPAVQDTDWAILHDELDRLPERLKTPLVLCYREGETYAKAAQQLKLSDATLRGRLSQAKKHLERRLSRRGVTVPAALIAAGEMTQSQAAVPATLIHSTVQIALGSTADIATAVLARGVLNSMLLKQVKVAAVLGLMTAVGITAGIAWAVGPKHGMLQEGNDPPAQTVAAGETAATKKSSPEPIFVHGFVVDDAGRPVAGASVRANAFSNREASGITGTDGSFRILIRVHQIDGIGLLTRSASADRLGFYRYDYNLSKADAEKPARIILKPGQDVVVRVTDSSQAAVSGASVQIAGNYAVLDDGTTGADGSVKLHVPTDAKVEWIVALKPGRGFDYAEFGAIDDHGRSRGGAIAATLPGSIALNLGASKTVGIKAVDRDGKPLAGVSFYPWLLHKDGRRSQVNFSSRIFVATTGPDGLATFDWLPANQESLTFWPASEGIAHRRVTLKEGESGTVTATLTRTTEIRGHVFHPDGSPAAGINVSATGTGQGIDNGHGQARTAADGAYEMHVSPGEAYAVFVDEKDWGARSRLDVFVRAGKAVDGVDFKLTRGTVVRGTVTIGAANKPAVGQYIRFDEAGGQAPEELREQGDRAWREVRRQVGTQTDASGHYSLRVGPGTYTLMGPPRTENEKITVNLEAELVRDFKMPRPEKGTLSGRVVRAGAGGEGVAGAKVDIAAANQLGIPFTVTAGDDGRFRAERDLDPLTICAKSRDGKLGAIVEVGAEAAEVVIAVSPTATATGILLDTSGQPASKVSLEWGRRVYLDDEQRLSMTCFAPRVVTDANGRFMLPGLVVGQEYDISLLTKNDVYEAAGAVRPEKAEAIDLGTLRAGSYHPRSLANAQEMSSFRKNAPDAGATAPAIDATTLGGKPLSLSDFKGKYVLLDFWATWCGPCIGEIPNLQSVYDAFGNDDRFTILSVSVDETIDEPQKFQEKRKLPWPQAYLSGGMHGPTPGKFGVQAIPAFVLVGPDGKIVARGMRGDEIKKAVEKALAKKS